MKAITYLAATLLACLVVAPVQAADQGSVVVIGSGQSGQPLARILVSQGYEVKIMTRNAERAAARGMPEGVGLVEGDATRPDTLTGDFDGVDYVISTIGAQCAPNQPPKAGSRPEDVDYRGIENLASAARAAGVKQFVLMSAIGAGEDDPEDGLNKMCDMVLKWKGDGEQALRDSGLPYTIVRPGGLKPFPGQPECVEGKEPLLIYGVDENRSGALCRADVGLVMADALGNPDALGKTVNLIADNSVGLEDWQSAWAEMPAD
jgi:uncharacterized protein YbjT (DUF2867 family)